MSRHYEDAEGLCENIDEETQSYVFNQTMLRIKDPKISLDFYTRIIGMKLYRKIDFPDMQFTLYFLAMSKDVNNDNVPEEKNQRTTWTFSQRAMLELTIIGVLKQIRILNIIMVTQSLKALGILVFLYQMFMKYQIDLKN